ncbi:SPOR domain-containing protein [Neolewinella antarctica]|uniref:SPOR domain-containing protein n=1 Tax=Neolewinella antarctica TaxID=442734 RepID=A0ABX0XE24_9BACT|nr:SPOR domain-containing protein [Neolewinella antarctica]NJC27525.1 hypothetical protein [Neolewinella antarctica]
MLRSLLFLAFTVLLGTGVRAQTSVTVDVDPKVEDLTELFVRTNEANTKVSGWRVQILATTDRARLETVETDFKVNYPNIPVDWVHTKPYYKLRAGAFLTKQEAERLKFTLNRQFEGVYLVKADVNKSELLRMY